MYTEHFVKDGRGVWSPFYQPKGIERHNKAIPLMAMPRAGKADHLWEVNFQHHWYL